MQADDCGPAQGQHGSVCKLSLQNLPRTYPLRRRGMFVSGANRWGLGRSTLYTGLKAASCRTWLGGHSPELMKRWGFPKVEINKQEARGVRDQPGDPNTDCAPGPAWDKVATDPGDSNPIPGKWHHSNQHL